MAHHDLGHFYHKQGKYEQAIAKYLHVIDLPPEERYGDYLSSSTHYNLAGIYRK